MAHEVEIRWTAGADGRVCTAVAKSSTGRIIARANAHVAYDKDPEDLYGPDGKKMIEDLAKDLCERLIPEADRT